jgi:hypothetical protein
MSDNICIRKQQTRFNANNIHLWIHALLTMCTGIGSSRLHMMSFLFEVPFARIFFSRFFFVSLIRGGPENHVSRRNMFRHMYMYL